VEDDEELLVLVVELEVEKEVVVLEVEDELLVLVVVVLVDVVVKTIPNFVYPLRFVTLPAVVYTTLTDTLVWSSDRT
jgi:hypothetical protein